VNHDALNALIGLNRGAVEESIALFQRAGMPDRIRHDPALYLYESAESYAAARAHWKKRDQVGLHSTHVGADEIQKLEPDLAPIFTASQPRMGHRPTPGGVGYRSGRARGARWARQGRGGRAGRRRRKAHSTASPSCSTRR
jgi:hypothetical protein